MKQLKKLLVIMMCAGVIMGLTACGTNKKDNNAATENSAATDNKTTTNNTGTANDTKVNDATDGTADEGVVDEIGDDIRDGAEDVGDALDGDRNNDGVRDNNATDNTDK